MSGKLRLFVKKLGKTLSKNPYKRLLVHDAAEAESSKKHGGVLLPRKGHVFLYVGEEKKRYQVPLKYLSSPTLRELIARSKPDVFDANIDGPLVLSCTTDHFDDQLMLKIAKGL